MTGVAVGFKRPEAAEMLDGFVRSVRPSVGFKPSGLFPSLSVSLFRLHRNDDVAVSRQKTQEKISINKKWQLCDPQPRVIRSNTENLNGEPRINLVPKKSHQLKPISKLSPLNELKL